MADTRSHVTPHADDSYPDKQLRYYRTWWNKNSQHCYTDEDITLLEKITRFYNDIIGDAKGAHYFKTDTRSTWYDWWTCTTPAQTVGVDQLDHLHNADTFTLPNRPAKDNKSFPLWSFSDSISKTIANWQSERVKNQHKGVMNDPVMLVLDEMRNWFYHNLSEKPCTPDVLEEINKRQSYLKTVIHTIPDFGPDRLRLNALSLSLNDASTYIRSCIANKELPYLLTDLTNAGRSLENTLASYLHFLLINEEVSDNFSNDMITSKQIACTTSPICKAYSTPAVAAPSSEIANTLSAFSKLHHFLQFQDEKSLPSTVEATATLNLAPLRQIKFASFVTDSEKATYLKALAALEALTTVRKTFEKFNHLQTKIGSYLFAAHFINQSDELTKQYIRLIDNSHVLISSLIDTAENGHNAILKSAQIRKENVHFAHNLRSLETQFAKGTTAKNQLEEFTRNTIEHIQRYQNEMKHLVTALESGKASREVTLAMNDLYQEMAYLNEVIPALLENKEIKIKTIENTALTTSVSSQTCHSQIKALTKGQCEAEAHSDPIESKPPSPAWVIKNRIDHEGVDIILTLNQAQNQPLEVSFSTSLKEIKHHPSTNQPIYVFAIKDAPERGTIEFYGRPELCVSQDKQTHNIIKTSGLFAELHLDSDQLKNQTNICDTMPPSFYETALSNVGHSALHGVLRGGATVFGEKYKPQPGAARVAATQAAYFSAVFVSTLAYNTYQEYTINGADPYSALSTAAVTALYETSVLSLVSTGTQLIGSALESTGDYLEQNNWSWTGSGIKRLGQLARYGLFAYNTVATSDVSTLGNAAKSALLTTSSLAAGVAAEKLTEKAMRHVVK